MEDMIPQGSLTPHDGPGYDTSDVDVRGILVFGVILILVTVLTMVILGSWYAVLASREIAYRQERPPRFAEDNAGQFPPPVIQPNPVSDMVEMRQADEQRLGSYGWVNEQEQIAHIPIDKAMELVIDRLQDGPAPAAQPAAPEPSAPAEGATPPEAGQSDPPPSTE